LVTFSAGTKDVFVVWPASQAQPFTYAESTAAPNATVYVDSITVNAASTDADIALVPKGIGAILAQVPDSTLNNGNKRGSNAVDFQVVRNVAAQVASGSYAFIGSGSRNTASGLNAVVPGGFSNTASGWYTVVAGGSTNSASVDYATVCGGISNTASGNYAFVGAGNTNTASSQHATVSGGSNNTANGTSATVVGGSYGTTRGIVGAAVFPACNQPIASSAGVTQAALLLLGAQTTDATVTTLRSDINAATTTNQVILPNNSAYYFRGSVVANVTGGGNTKAWTFEGAIKRGASAAATTLIQSVINPVAEDSGAATWAIALAADTTNGGLQVTVTGQASTTIRWVCKIETTEVTY
jgi:hypothetical protein